MDAWEEEREHLRRIIPIIERQMEDKRKIAEDRHTDLQVFRREFWEDMSLNTETPEDRLETVADLTQRAGTLANNEHMYGKAVEALRKLEKQLPSPYFGRVDFVEEGLGYVSGESGQATAEPFYVGILALMDEQTHNPLIFDWRAPVSQLFYDFSPGLAEYRVPDGTIRGNITLKRQFVIRDGVLENMFDTGIRIVDELLLGMLGKHADDRMKTIVTTIQKEQNEIIREDRYPLLIVQGSAGSGKTSVALQRVAYLLYKYRHSLDAGQIILFSPNRLFNDYISTVLPELGERNMRQTTFQEYLDYRLETDAEPEDLYDQMESLLLTADEKERQIRLGGIRFKAQRGFVQLIRAYAESLQSDGLLFKDCYAGKRLAVSKDELAQRFYAKDKHLPVSRRLNKLGEWLERELEDKQEEFTKRYFRQLMKAPNYIGTESELKVMAKKTMAKRFAPLHRMAKRMAFIDLEGTYGRLLTDEALFAELAIQAEVTLPGEWKEAARRSAERLDAGEVPYEDAVAMLYLQETLQGWRVYHGIRHVVIDEAQDYTPFHFELIRRMFPRSKMTLLGDWNQAIFPHSVEPNYRSVQEMFQEGESHLYRLFKSYRSTQEIVEFTQAILPGGERIEAFSRHGERPELRQAASQEELSGLIEEAIGRLKEAGYASIAVICRTAEESLRAYQELSGELKAALVTKDTRTYRSGLLVLPAYLAKGLEFDAVIVYNAGADVYNHESERRLFYTACTRAMHRLQLFSIGPFTSFISE
jgi:DNA helicase-2/ATP-dependent DNA helicase PcrA